MRGDTTLFVSSKRRRLDAQNFAVIFIFIFHTTYEKDQLHRISGSEFYEWLFGPEHFSGFSRNGSLFLGVLERHVMMSTLKTKDPLIGQLSHDVCGEENRDEKIADLNNRFHSSILVYLHARVLCQHNDGGFLAQDGKLVVTHVSSQHIRAIRFLVTREGVIFSVESVHMRASKDHRSA